MGSKSITTSVRLQESDDRTWEHLAAQLGVTKNAALTVLLRSAQRAIPAVEARVTFYGESGKESPAS